MYKYKLVYLMKKMKLPYFLYLWLRDLMYLLRHQGSSYSQFGEDLIIDKYFKNKEGGIYVDVGCSHPFRISNTYFLYKKNWKGVVIDPIHGFKTLYSIWRKRDLFLPFGVASNDGELNYFEVIPSVLSSFDEPYIKTVIGEKRAILYKKTVVQVISINNVLKKAEDLGKINLLSVDVEGLDESIIKSIDFKSFNPECICVEYNSEHEEVRIRDYLALKGYSLLAKTKSNQIFVNNE